MCNDFGNTIPYSAYVEEFSQLRLPIVAPGPGASPNLEPRDEIWPTEAAPVLCPVAGGVALVQVPWGLAGRGKAPVVINMRAEGRRFEHGRCLVPASHYFEFTGRRSPKTRWRFTRRGQDWFCFAGLLGRGPGGDAFSLLTVDAGPDVAAVHTRQPALLDRAHWAAWLAGAPDLLHPSPAGSLDVVESPRAQARTHRAGTLL